MKYIVYEDGSAVVFANTVSHKDMVNGRPVRSAGFCMVETYRNQFDDIRAKVSCYGESSTLKVQSDPDDSKIIEAFWRD